MRILLVGSGGREHAVLHALLSEDTSVDVYVAPGNAGTARHATNVDIRADDVDALVDFAIGTHIDLTIVGPEQPLVLGIADKLRAAGVAVVGPGARAARLEGSKVFAKNFMARRGIPTAAYRTFGQEDYEQAVAFLHELGAPVVVKASGLAAGKGAVVCPTLAEAHQALREMLIDRTFGDAGAEVVVEEFMTGEEASIFAVCDGTTYVLLSPAQDHKRANVGDTGPNTGGMGAYAPAPVVDEALLGRVESEIIVPTLNGLVAEGTAYNGFLYVGLMIDRGVPRVVEYNCRLGDPEAQVVLPLLDGSLLGLMRSTAAGRLNEHGPVRLRSGAAACVVLCSGGYPRSYQKGYPIRGLESAEARRDAIVFHAGTTVTDGRVVTNGGRVLGVTGLGESLDTALESAYGAVGEISFEKMHFRSDIGERGLKRLELA